MQADDWIVYSMTHRCELARVRCGGWRRQYAGLCSSPTDFTFAYYRDRKIHIERRHQPAFEPATAGAILMRDHYIFFEACHLPNVNGELIGHMCVLVSTSDCLYLIQSVI